MKYLLDTNIIIYYLKGMYPQIGEWFRHTPASDIYVSTITVAELEYGARGSNNYEKNMSTYRQFISAFQIVDFDVDAAICYGDIRNNLKNKGIPIGANDMHIAASALSKGLVVLTHNSREFERVDNLVVFDPCEDSE